MKLILTNGLQCIAVCFLFLLSGQAQSKTVSVNLTVVDLQGRPMSNLSMIMRSYLYPHESNCSWDGFLPRCSGYDREVVTTVQLGKTDQNGNIYIESLAYPQKSGLFDKLNVFFTSAQHTFVRGETVGDVNCIQVSSRRNKLILSCKEEERYQERH